MNLIPEFEINSAEIIDNDNYVDSDTRNLQYSQRRTDGQRFEFRLRSVKLQESVLKSVMAWLGGVRRDNTTLTVKLPILSDSAVGTRTVTAPAGVGAKSVSMNTTDIEIGDFVTFASHKKAYQVTDFTGTKIDINPLLLESVANTEVATFDGVKFSCKVRGRAQKYNVSGNDDSAVVEIDLVEVWT